MGSNELISIQDPFIRPPPDSDNVAARNRRKGSPRHLSSGDSPNAILISMYGVGRYTLTIHNFTVSPLHSITASQYHSITASQYHNFTTSQYHDPAAKIGSILRSFCLYLYSKLFKRKVTVPQQFLPFRYLAQLNPKQV